MRSKYFLIGAGISALVCGGLVVAFGDNPHIENSTVFRRFLYLISGNWTCCQFKQTDNRNSLFD